MRLVLLANLVALAIPSMADDQSTNRVRDFVLNPRVVVQIPVARDRITTVRFPSPISDVEGLSIAAEPEPRVLFQYNFRPGSQIFSLRAITTNATVNLNVIWREKIYALELLESSQPWFAVNFVESNRPPVRPAASRAQLGPIPFTPTMASASPVTKSTF